MNHLHRIRRRDESTFTKIITENLPNFEIWLIRYRRHLGLQINKIGKYPLHTVM
jgi:hypothetical protein